MMKKTNVPIPNNKPTKWVMEFITSSLKVYFGKLSISVVISFPPFAMNTIEVIRAIITLLHQNMFSY